MLTGYDIVGLMVVSVTIVMMYRSYLSSKPDPDGPAQDEADRAARVAHDAQVLEENEKKRLLDLEMAKLGYIQKPVMERETIEERESDYGETLTNTTRTWQLAWVKDEPKAQAVLES